MNLIEQLQEARKIAGMPEYSHEQVVALAEKKLSGQEKEDFLAKMSGKKTKKSTDGEVDGGSNNTPSKGAKKALDDAAVKGSVSGKKGPEVTGGKGPNKGKGKRVSEQLNAVLEGAGLQALSEEDAAKVDAKYPEEE